MVMQITRRRFIKIAGSAIITTSLLGVTTIVPAKAGLIRPPGAVKEDDFNKVCLRCQQCVDVCPEKALSGAHLTDGWNNTATPVLEKSCTLCMKCSKLCPSGALVPIAPEQAKMGTAYIIDKECVGCDKCIKPCPRNAISKVPGKRLVKIDAALCTGCMTCVQACPVKPIAIVVTSTGAKRPSFGTSQA
jgi:ferredoxin-type protein NapG